MNEEFDKILENKLKENYNDFFNLGLMNGWDVCCKTLYNVCKTMTSAKKIKEFLKEKSEEADKRIEVRKSEPKTDTALI